MARRPTRRKWRAPSKLSSSKQRWAEVAIRRRHQLEMQWEIEEAEEKAHRQNEDKGADTKEEEEEKLPPDHYDAQIEEARKVTNELHSLKHKLFALLKQQIAKEAKTQAAKQKRDSEGQGLNPPEQHHKPANSHVYMESSARPRHRDHGTWGGGAPHPSTGPPGPQGGHAGPLHHGYIAHHLHQHHHGPVSGRSGGSGGSGGYPSSRAPYSNVPYSASPRVRASPGAGGPTAAGANSTGGGGGSRYEHGYDPRDHRRTSLGTDSQGGYEGYDNYAPGGGSASTSRPRWTDHRSSERGPGGPLPAPSGPPGPPRHHGYSGGGRGPPPGTWRDRDVRGDPRDMRGDPRDMRGDPRDMRGDPRDMRGDPRDMRGDPRDMRGDPRDMRGDPRDMRGDPRDMRGDPRDMRGDPRDMRGDPRDGPPYRTGATAVSGVPGYGERRDDRPPPQGERPSRRPRYNDWRG